MLFARLCGSLMPRVGQPRVMGEVIAGLCLGPTLLGAISPTLQSTSSRRILARLGVVANLGLIFYMFLVGLEVDRGSLKGKVAKATAISNTSVAVPMLLGIAIALPLYKLIGPDKKFVAFALFMGVAMSITAFPVLARILAERRMIKRPIGVAGDRVRRGRRRHRVVPDRARHHDRVVGDVRGRRSRRSAEAVAYTLVMVLIVRRIVARGDGVRRGRRLPGTGSPGSSSACSCRPT